ncbi:MAG TPA: hypothetical protein VFC24_06115, partial [Casimicrobiaceae bacterium]|nr:hypothetical protein [Casimicrobiaceae bacterium]
GIYIPALLVERALQQSGFGVDVQVIEAYYTPQHQQAHFAHRDAHHASFALAQLAHRMARGVVHCVDDARMTSLLERWRREERRRFIVWAGFWLPFLARYAAGADGLDVAVDHCRIDAIVSASFRVHPELDARGREIWLWSRREGRLVHEIPVTSTPPLAWRERADRLLVHGGGWGIGTYRATLSELVRTPFAVDLVVHSTHEASGLRDGDRAYMLDPSWHAWQRDADDRLAFPPMRRVVRGALADRLDGGDGHALHEIIRTCKAIVSKPGGCTLIDCLAAGTPVVLLEPYGDAEQANAKLWIDLGFGIDYAAWRDTGFDPSVLDRLHSNIVARSPGVDYPAAYVAELERAS